MQVVSLRTLQRITALAVCCALAGCAVEPEPLSDETIAELVASTRVEMTAGQEPVTRAIDLHEAIARALKYNLDVRVAALQRDLKVRDFERANFTMLPSLVANTGFSARDNDSGGTSQSLLTNTQSLVASTSQERRGRIANLNLSWNILDFGLSYVRAQQTADEALIADEARRKAVNQIIEEVQTTFWRAVTSEKLASDLRRLKTRLEDAIRRTRKLASDNQTSPIDALTSERELVDLKRELLRLSGDLQGAKTQLAGLMNIDPSSDFSLVMTASPIAASELGSASDMIDVALNNRSEIAEIALKLRINRHEADAALLELLPGIQLYSEPSYDSNKYLFNNDWVSWGAKASWNLVKIAQYPARLASVEAGDEVLHEKSLAVTMAVMTQVYISRIRYAHSRAEFATAADYLDVQTRLVSKMRLQASAEKISEQKLIREELNTVIARVKRDMAYATLQGASANIYSTLGLEPCSPDFIAGSDVETIAQRLRAGQSWQEASLR